MVSFGERIRDLADRLGKDEKDVAADLGLSKSKMSHYVNGRNKVPSELLQEIVSKYNINPQFLFDENAPLYSGKERVSRYPYLPVLVAAGLPENINSITNDDVEQIEIPDSIMGKWAGSNDIYFMRVNGESMNNVIPDQSLIAVKPINLPNLKNGDIVVYSDGNDYSVKRFYQNEDKLIFRPDSDNMAFTDYIASADNSNIRIHGKVVIYIVELD